MSKNVFILSAVAVAMTACSTFQTSVPQPLLTAPAPITFDGNVAGQATDYVFMLVSDVNPTVRGLAMGAGESLQIALPVAFKRNTATMLNAETDANLVLTKGWPQGGVQLAGQYRVGYNEKSNTVTVTASRDIAAEGANAPGIKRIHLRGRTFINPMAGNYTVTVTHVAADGKSLANWRGQLNVLEDAPSARLAPTNFHLPPGTNSDYQRAMPGQVVTHPLGLLLWGKQGAALDDVGIAARDLTRFPRYTGGLLVQDSNHDKRLDPATDTVVGGIIGAAPQGAKGQAATSPIGADGHLILSGQVLRNAAFPAAVGGGKPNRGLLAIQFRAGDLPGLYRPIVELLNGNSYQFTVEVVAP